MAEVNDKDVFVATPGLAGLQETNNTYQDAYSLKDVFLPAYKKLEESPLN